MNRPTKFDWLIYRLFRYFWNPILKENHKLRMALAHNLYFFDEIKKDAL
jgi:hypothetical protein